jgi:hypothetical protein
MNTKFIPKGTSIVNMNKYYVTLSPLIVGLILY